MILALSWKGSGREVEGKWKGRQPGFANPLTYYKVSPNLQYVPQTEHREEKP